MRTLANIVWFLLGGIWLAIAYALAGVLACIFIVTIPAGIASFRMAQYVLWPFGKAVVPAPNAGAGSAIMNAVWFVIAGWWLALAHLVTAFAQALTIVGLLNVAVNLKMIPISMAPFGKRIVDRRDLRPGTEPLHSM